MASSKEYLAFVRDQLASLPDISARAMMGENVLYCRGKAVGGVYDDRLLLKPTPGVLHILAEEGLAAEYDLPYPGAKEQLIAPVDESALLCRLVSAIADDLPEKRKRG